MRVVSWNMNKRKEGNWEWIIENSEPDYVMAQEAIEVFPEAVSMHQDGYLQVDYARIG